MNHICSICKKWVPKLHFKSHLQWHLRYPYKSKYPDITERTVDWLLCKLALK